MRKVILLSLVLLLFLMPVSAWANTQSNVVIRDVQVFYGRGLTEMEGEVKYVTNLETPHYELNGIVLVSNINLKNLEGYYVKVKGYMLEGPSIFMKKRMLVTDYEIIYKNKLVELVGEVKYVRDVGPPHYELNGIVLEADFNLRRLAGRYVKVKGYMLEGPSIFMKERMVVRDYEILHPNKLVELEGEVKYIRNLEIPHYEINGVVLEAGFELSGLTGYYVKVKGYMLDGPSIFMKERMLVRDYEILNKGEVLKLKGIVGEGLRFNGYVLTSNRNLRPYIGKEVEITAIWDMDRSNSKQKYLQVLTINEVKRTRTQIVRERIDPNTGIRYIIRNYI